jgi:hypothetical protein
VVEVIVKSDGRQASLQGVNPNHPLWFIAFDQQPAPPPSIKILPSDCLEPVSLRLSVEDCMPGVVTVSGTRPSINLSGR